MGFDDTTIFKQRKEDGGRRPVFMPVSTVPQHTVGATLAETNNDNVKKDYFPFRYPLLLRLEKTVLNMPGTM